MRMVEVRALLRELVGEIDVLSVAHSGGDGAVVSGIRRLQATIELLSHYGLFEKETESIQDYREFMLATDLSAAGRKPRADSFVQEVSSLAFKAARLLAVLEEVIPLQGEETISFRLPDDLDLSRAAEMMVKLDKILSQAVVNKYVDGCVQLKSFDRGSCWMDLFLGSKMAVWLIENIVRIYFNAKNRQKDLNAKLIFLDDVKAQVEMREQARKLIIDTVRRERDADLKSVLGELKVPENERNEYAGRVRNSLKDLGELLDQGLQVHPSLDPGVGQASLLPKSGVLEHILKRVEPNAGVDESDDSEQE